MAIKNWNKLIDMEFIGDNDSFKIVCPSTGRKPTATISGTMAPEDTSCQMNLRVTNLYTSKPLSDYHTLKVYVGYEGSQMCCLEGSIYNVYVEKPGPDKVVVVSCNNNSMSAWLNTTVKNLKYKKNKDNLQTVIKKLSDSLGFASPSIASELQSKALPCDIQFDGTAKDLVHKIRAIFPDINITVNDNRIVVLGESDKVNEFTLSNITAPPQISGGTVTVTAPWIPGIRPGDFVNVTTSSYVTSTVEDGKKIQSKDNKLVIKVVSINFNFSTTGPENSMSIQGTLQ